MEARTGKPCPDFAKGCCARTFCGSTHLFAGSLDVGLKEVLSVVQPGGGEWLTAACLRGNKLLVSTNTGATRSITFPLWLEGEFATQAGEVYYMRCFDQAIPDVVFQAVKQDGAHGLSITFAATTLTLR